MRKDGIQTRKRKPKKNGSSVDELRVVGKKDEIGADIKPSLERNMNNKLISPASPKAVTFLTSQAPPRSHSHLLTPHQSYNSPSHSNSHHSNIANTSIPSKYDFPSPASVSLSCGSLSHNHTSHIYTNPTNTNSHHSNNYLHHHHHHQSNNLPQSFNGNLKSEPPGSGNANVGSNAVVGGGNLPVFSNYDYMNNCIQNGYFGGSFGATATTTAHHSPASELTGYHHQHNVIQAAKLMASS